MQDNAPLTIGVDHAGLAVKNLENARRFFCECLGWKVVGENQSYPASFVSDGNGIVTLWQVEDSENCVAFDRRRNVGLHILPSRLPTARRSTLARACRGVADTVIEFAPERSARAPRCTYGAGTWWHPHRIRLRLLCGGIAWVQVGLDRNSSEEGHGHEWEEEFSDHGCRSGFGRALATEALSSGCSVIGTVRSEPRDRVRRDGPARARAIVLDVTDFAAIGPWLRRPKEMLVR